MLSLLCMVTLPAQAERPGNLYCPVTRKHKIVVEHQLVYQGRKIFFC